MLETACAEPSAQKAEAAPVSSGSHWPRRVLRIGLALPVLWLVWKVCQVYALGNIDEVIPGRIYRGAQPLAQSLEKLIDRFGIRTVLNVRGCCYPDQWYLDEAGVCQRRGVQLVDVSFSAVHLPSRHEVRRLIEVLERAESPIFIHCRHGADRTGIAAMAAQLLLTEQSYDSAHRQLGLRYGHVAIGKPAMLDRFVKLYADWLKRTGKEHAPAHFRHWAMEEYRGGWCDARFEKVERLFDTPRLGKSLQYDVVVRNTGPEPWRFTTLKYAGHHVTFKLLDEGQNIVHEGRAGMLDAVVEPGATIRVTVIVPPIHRPGNYRLLVDLIEEGHCWFHQTGAEPYEEEFALRD